MSTPLIRTYTGKMVNPLDLRLEDIDLKDIAHALACINRFNGHTKKPINVAQHSVYVSRLVQHAVRKNFLNHEDTQTFRVTALQALFHDGAEAYIGDVTKWLKADPCMDAFRDAEDRAQEIIYVKFGLPIRQSSLVDWADRVMVRFEGGAREGFGRRWMQDLRRAADGNASKYDDLTEDEIAAVGAWKPWSWRESEEGFLTQYRLLTKE